MKRGFTIIELLVVIGIIALLLIIAVPSILNTRNNTLKGISAEEENNLKEAGKLLGIDLDDYMSDVYNCKSGSWIEGKCSKSSGNWVEVKVSVDDLKSNGYFQDDKAHCSGELTVTKATNTYTVTFMDTIECE